MKLRELRLIVRALVKEAMDAQTIPARHSDAEKELSSKHPTWGNSQAKKMQQQSPAQTKAKQVAAVLKQKGADGTPNGAKAITQQLLPWLQEYDPQELFVMDPADLADEFAQKFLAH